MTTTLIMLVAQAWDSPALGATTCRTTSYERTVDRRQTLCDDGTRAVSRYKTMLNRWHPTITASPRQARTATLNPRTQQVEVRCH
jgi:hypothetical protein